MVNATRDNPALATSSADVALKNPRGQLGPLSCGAEEERPVLSRSIHGLISSDLDPDLCLDSGRGVRPRHQLVVLRPQRMRDSAVLGFCNPMCYE